MAQSARNQYCVHNLNFETAGLSRPPLPLGPSANPRPRIPPLRPGPRPSAPPKASAKPQKYTDYSDVFYDNHVLYEAFGVYREQSFEEIQGMWAKKLDDAWARTSQKPHQRKALGDYVSVVIASKMFTTKQKKNYYDQYGDTESKPTQEDHSADFYQTHCLYAAVGAYRYWFDNQMLCALTTTALQVLRDQRNSVTGRSETVRKFKMLWYDACDTFLNLKRRTVYDTNGDTTHTFIDE